MSRKATINIKKSTVYITGAIVVLALVGTYMGTYYLTNKDSDRTTLQTNGEVDEETLRQYENTSLKDKETLSSLISTLPGGRNIDNVEPHVEKKPFGVRLHGTDKLTGKEIEQLSEQILSLVKDCEWVEINSSQFHAKTTKDGLQEFSVIN